MEDFGLTGKVLVVVTDSAANMKKAFESEAVQLHPEEPSVDTSVDEDEESDSVGSTIRSPFTISCLH